MAEILVRVPTPAAPLRGEGQFKDEMELALSASLGRGDSAATVSRHVRQYLQEPDRLFRRVRDEKGNLKLSKRAAAYHPGRGEYRSSYKNAMRLARTETNMAYRSADYERRQRHPWIVGVEVKRVHDKTVCKLCDALAGKYPKDFKFVGWHPQCRCYTIDVLAPVDEVNAYHRAMLDGEDVSGWQFSGQITEPHEDFKKWMKENQERVEKAAKQGTLPYWMKDNPKYVGVKQTAQAHEEEKVFIGSAAMPKGLGFNNQKTWNNNEMNVSERLDVKQGWPMSHEEADEHRANPNYVNPHCI